MPPRWYEAHLTAPSLNVVGFTVPGLPFVIVGRNDEIAWGITNMMVDDCDFFWNNTTREILSGFCCPMAQANPSVFLPTPCASAIGRFWVA